MFTGVETKDSNRPRSTLDFKFVFIINHDVILFIFVWSFDLQISILEIRWYRSIHDCFFKENIGLIRISLSVGWSGWGWETTGCSSQVKSRIDLGSLPGPHHWSCPIVSAWVFWLTCYCYWVDPGWINLYSSSVWFDHQQGVQTVHSQWWRTNHILTKRDQGVTDMLNVNINLVWMWPLDFDRMDSKEARLNPSGVLQKFTNNSYDVTFGRYYRNNYRM